MAKKKAATSAAVMNNKDCIAFLKAFTERLKTNPAIHADSFTEPTVDHNNNVTMLFEGNIYNVERRLMIVQCSAGALGAAKGDYHTLVISDKFTVNTTTALGFGQIIGGTWPLAMAKEQLYENMMLTLGLEYNSTAIPAQSELEKIGDALANIPDESLEEILKRRQLVRATKL